jgi:hypothetical protein
MMIRAVALCLCLLLAGCGNSTGYKPQPMGWAGPISLFRVSDLTWEEASWVTGAANAHATAFTMGYSVVADTDVEMMFAGQATPTRLVRQGTLLSRPGHTFPIGKRFSAVVSKAPVSGANPAGPGISYRALRCDEYGDPAAMIQLDEKCTMHGLYTIMMYNFEADQAPKDQVGWYRWWAEVYEMDRLLSEMIRKSRR